MRTRNALLIVLSVCLITVFAPSLLKLTTKNSFWGFNGEQDAYIATAVGGFTAPIIGLVSAILIFLAFMAQVNLNRAQQRQANALLLNDIITSILRRIADDQILAGESRDNLTLFGRDALNQRINYLTKLIAGEYFTELRYYPLIWIFIDIIRKFSLCDEVIRANQLDPIPSAHYRTEIDAIKRDFLVIADHLFETINRSTKFQNDPIAREIIQFYTSNANLRL